MSDHRAQSDPPPISSDRVMEILQREPLGAALLRAAIAEATAEAWQAKCEQLERPSGAMADPGPHR